MNLAIPDTEYMKYGKNLYKDKDRFIEEATFELTYRCNLNCVHCWCNDLSLKRREEELKFNEICMIMDKIANEGCLWICFTGGEPLIREDFFDLYLYAKKKGFMISVLTNATLIDEKTADFFAEWPPRLVEITLYGIKEKTYEQVTGVKGSFRKCMGAIERLAGRKINLEIKTMLLTINKHEIKAMSDFARNLGVNFRHDPFVHSKLNGDKSPHQFRLAAEEIVEIESEMKNMPGYWQKQCKSSFNLKIECEKLYICGAGRGSFFVDPYGGLRTCGVPCKHVYDLKKGSFEEGWYNFIPWVVDRKRSNQDFVCQDCQIRGMCSQCPNLAYLEKGDEEKVVDYICAVFKERAKRFGKEVLINAGN